MRTLICHNCGGELVRGSRISNNQDKTEYVVRCLQCNLEFDRYSGEYYKEFIDSFIFDKDTSVFEVGLKGSLYKIEYKIVGRIRYQDESSYEKSTWDEWILKTSTGKFSYIVEENDRIYLYQEHKPESINISETELKELSIEFEGEAVKKVLSYTGRVVIAEGEIPLIIETGDGVQFYDFKRYGEDYTLKRFDGTDRILRGKKVDLREVVEGFNIKKLQDSCNRMEKKRRSFIYESRIYALGMILSLILSVYNCFGGIPVKDVMNSKRVLSENILIGEDDDQVYESQILYGSFDVPEKNKLYNVTIRIGNNKLLEAEPLTFRLMLIGENRLTETLSGKSDIASLKETFDRIDAFMNPVESYMISGYIYGDYNNADYKSVYKLSRESNFVVDESGKYYFYLEFFSNSIIDMDSISVSMSMIDGNRFYLIISFIFFILWGVCNKCSRYYKEFTKSMLK